MNKIQGIYMMDYYIFIKIVFRKIFKLYLNIYVIIISVKKQYSKWIVQCVLNFWKKELELCVFVYVDNYVQI